MQLYCMFCGGKLLKSGEGMVCLSCKTKFNGMISESEINGVIERSICMDCITIKQKTEVTEVELTIPLPQSSREIEVKA